MPKLQTAGTSQVIGGVELAPCLGSIKSAHLSCLDTLAKILIYWWAGGVQLAPLHNLLLKYSLRDLKELWK